MVSGTGSEVVERKILSAKVVRAIQSIKEVVKNHSDADIYAALQETNMDPNETAQKLLNQDPFHEVKRKKDKKKEVRLPQNTGHRGPIEVKKPIEHVERIIKSNRTDDSVPRGAYIRNSLPGGNREFRVVRDNRNNKNVTREVKSPSLQSSTSSNQKGLPVSEKGSTAVNQKSSVVPETQKTKPNDSKRLSAELASNQSVVGVYSSSSDPVHVPSPDSKSGGNVGAIRRQLGAVGVRRQTSVTPSSAQSNSLSASSLVKDVTSSSEPLKPLTVTSTNDKPPKTSTDDKLTKTSTDDKPTKISQPQSVLPSRPSSRSSSSNQYNSRSHQQVAGHKKASQPAKEWKRKAVSKSNTNGNGVIGPSSKSVSHSMDSSKNLEIDVAHVRDELSQVDIYENQNVIIAEHIRVSESDRSRLTFGSFGTEGENPSLAREEENPSSAVSISLSASTPEVSVDTSASKHVNSLDNQVHSPGLNSESGGLPENLLPDKKDTSSPPNLDNYSDIGLVLDNSTSLTRTESEHQQDPAELANFSVYNPQTGYDIPYYRSSMDEPVREQGLQSSQEVLGSHMTNIPVSSVSMVQQQQMPQMYQQVHVSPFGNVMPYRQYISPLYAPQIQMTGYSGNPTYPHPSNGNNFLLMSGASNLKYGIQHFKPVPAGSATGFGNFATPTGYAMNPPGVIGSATGIDESSRLKYKDGNLYVPNPQAETSDLWMQNPREFSGMQSASYYNLAGQTPHGAYMPPHPGHTSFTTVAQSSHMQQFPGLYHPSPPPQGTAMANPHHLAAAMGGGSVNIGMGSSSTVAPGAQMGAYQQPQMSHLNWNTNF